MNIKNILLISVLLVLTLVSCQKAKQPTGNTATATTTVAGKENSDDKQVKNTTSQIYAKTEVPVLCYHRITDAMKSEYAVTPATFAAQIKILADSGYHSILPAQLYDYLVYNKSLPEKPVMITFDDSRVEQDLIGARVLEKHGFKGVFFIMTITYNKKNYMTTEEIVALAKKGHTIGLHSWDHTMVIKYKDAADWKKQVSDPKTKLEKIVGMPVEYWAYPNGVYDQKGAKELSKYFKLSFSLFSKRDSIYPLQTVRRIIVPEMTPQKLLKSMRVAFTKKKK